MIPEPPKTLEEVQRLIEQHKRRSARSGTAKKKAERQSENGWDRIRARMRRWQVEEAPLHRLTCDASRPDHHIHAADLQQLVAGLKAKGIRFRRVWRTRLRAERRGQPIAELDSELIRRFAQQILDHIG